MSETSKKEIGAALFEGVRHVFFDLFDTLIEVDNSKLPTVVHGEHEFPSTAPAVLELVHERGHGHITLEQFVAEVIRQWQVIAKAKEKEWIEISALVRYENIVHALELEVEGEESRRLAHELVETHMRAIARSTRAVEGAAELLDRLHAKGIGVALISNFDYTPAADWILDHTGLQGRFDKVIISDALGLRKPHEKLFEDAMSHFGASPADSLHIGDTALADIWGAGRLGIRTVWINRKGEAFPHDEHAPSLEITRLAELLDYLPD